MAGGAVGGFIGAFFALPIAAIIQAFLSTYSRRYEVVEEGAEDGSAAEVGLVESHTPLRPDPLVDAPVLPVLVLACTAIGPSERSQPDHSPARATSPSLSRHGPDAARITQAW
jgi:hypothetical protein